MFSIPGTRLFLLVLEFSVQSIDLLLLKRCQIYKEYYNMIVSLAAFLPVGLPHNKRRGCEGD